MLDIRLVRDDPGAVTACLARRGPDAADVGLLADLDTRVRDAIGRRDEIRARVKELSRQVGAARKSGDTAAAEQLRAESRALGEAEAACDAEATAAQERLRDLLLRTPNLPSPDCPDGAGPEDNVVVRTWPAAGFPGRDAYPPYQRVPHWEIGEELGLLDMGRGAKLSGSMFAMYRGLGARMLRALTSFALDGHADAYEEIRPPTLVRTETMVSTGHLPKFADEAYHVERDGLWAIPTAEVPLASMARDDIVDEADLPLRLTAATSCFRREAGAAGRDTRGLLRVHEFDKVELFVFATPEQAAAEHADMVRRATGLLEALELPYRVLDLCAGDLGDSARRTFDLEVYAPGADRWLEVSSISWCGDYQARRSNVRYRPADGGRPVLVETLNGSALAWARIWAALVEINRQSDGSVRIPAALQPYLGGLEQIPGPPR